MAAANVHEIAEPVQRMRQVVAAMVLLAYCIPIIYWTIYGALHINSVSGVLEDADILGTVTALAENSTNALNIVRQLALPLIAAFTASLLTRNAHTNFLFGVLVVTSTLALLASVVGIFLFAPSDWEKAAVNKAFYSDLASSLAVYVMLLVGLKI